MILSLKNLENMANITDPLCFYRVYDSPILYLISTSSLTFLTKLSTKINAETSQINANRTLAGL